MSTNLDNINEKDSRGWYAAVSAPEFDPNPGKNGMGQIWVRRKNHPGAEKLWGGSLLSVLKKKQCWLHSNCRNGDGSCWKYPTKTKEKTPGNKTWGLWLRGQDLNLRSRLPPRSARGRAPPALARPSGYGPRPQKRGGCGLKSTQKRKISGTPQGSS